MSWLSDLFGGGHHNDALELWQAQQQQATQQAAQAKAEQDAKDAQTKADIAAKRTQGISTARTSADDYFKSMGLNPAEFAGDEDQKINEALSYSADDDPNIGSYLKDLGSTIYNNRQNALRSNAGRQVDLAFSPDYSTSRIGDTADDDILNQINTQQRGSAENYITNLLKRGVITSSGQSAAEKNLDDQGSRVRTILDELGKSTLDTGRQGLTDITNRARQTAGSLALGNNFNVGDYTNQADQAYNDFMSKIGDSIKAKAPTNLYDTTNLANIAGGSQGAGNFKFDPKALAGLNTGDNTNPAQDDGTDTKRITF